MAVSIALYALGLALESRPRAGSSALIPIAIGFGCIATLIFLGDLVYLGRKEMQRRRALRAPRKVFGRLDYEPEFIAATGRYADALRQITEATTRYTAVFARNQTLASQAQADECAAAARELCDAYKEQSPLMKDSGEVARQCLTGFLNASRISSDKDRDDFRTLRETTKTARVSTVGLLGSTRGSKKSTARLRKQNFSLSLNELAIRLRGHLTDSTRVLRIVIRGQRKANRQMSRRLSWYSVRSCFRAATNRAADG
jgi:hypothetical protein